MYIYLNYSPNILQINIMSSNKKKIDFIVITGSTATGKTKVAVDIAKKFGGEIISADSRQIYRGMDIGTGKDISEYETEDTIIPYHLIDILDPEQNYSVYQFQRDFLSAYDKVKKKSKIPILCGGTGLYIESILLKYKLQNAPPPNVSLRSSLESLPKENLLDLLKKVSKKDIKDYKIDTKNRIIRNIEVELNNPKNNFDIFDNRNLNNFMVIGMKIDRDKNRLLIKKRLNERLDNGLIEEVEKLLKEGLSISRLNYFGLEYKFVGLYLEKEINKDQLREQLYIAICQFAKRQDSWFRRMAKKGVKIHWISPERKEEINKLIEDAI